ncbi:MAG TPA: hypothetical protein VE619_11655 [Nitrososphaeraceae archaeon]|nr:hypothetical protein [Nitrososphaeraceae archaeon]
MRSRLPRRCSIAPLKNTNSMNVRHCRWLARRDDDGGDGGDGSSGATVIVCL